MAYVIEVDGEHRSLGKSPSLERLQEAVGGYIEAVHTPTGALCYVNEEGLLKRLPFNQTASLMVGRPLVGPIVVLEDGDE